MPSRNRSSVMPTSSSAVWLTEWPRPTPAGFRSFGTATTPLSACRAARPVARARQRPRGTRTRGVAAHSSTPGRRRIKARIAGCRDTAYGSVHARSRPRGFLHRPFFPLGKHRTGRHELPVPCRVPASRFQTLGLHDSMQRADSGAVDQSRVSKPAWHGLSLRRSLHRHRAAAVLLRQKLLLLT